jgi:hypothetical protein
MAAHVEKSVAPNAASDTTAFDWAIGYSFAGTTITLNLATTMAAGLDPSANGPATTGDIRDIMYAVLSHVYDVQEARADLLGTPTGSSTDVLEGMVVTKSETMTSRANGDRKITFQFSFTRTIGDNDSYPTPFPLDGTPGVED